METVLYGWPYAGLGLAVLLARLSPDRATISGAGAMEDERMKWVRGERRSGPMQTSGANGRGCRFRSLAGVSRPLRAASPSRASRASCQAPIRRRATLINVRKLEELRRLLRGGH